MPRFEYDSNTSLNREANGLVPQAAMIYSQAGTVDANCELILLSDFITTTVNVSEI